MDPIHQLDFDSCKKCIQTFSWKTYLYFVCIEKKEENKVTKLPNMCVCVGVDVFSNM